ncbi:porin family protein [Thalassotalea nanhaiensis]|uniref:Porin family protein n=1 Tax=Thalassotalea nanhaiensis TaxID=3065648 RepID=A0ABY9TLR8_9GAMM|nr:porin family protein [Colwelliaceae bacterium SQ345]
MKNIVLAVSICTASFSTLANTEKLNEQTETHFYAGALLSQSIHSSDSFDELNFSTAIARFGYSFTTNMAIEARVGASMDEDEVNGVSKNVDSLAGIYAVGTMPITKKFSFYGLIGVSSVEVTSTYGDSESSDTLTAASLGAGVAYNISDSLAINLEAVDYVDEKHSKYGAVSAGVSYRF